MIDPSAPSSELTIREYMAVHFMAAVIASDPDLDDWGETKGNYAARLGVEYADSLIKYLGKTGSDLYKVRLNSGRIMEVAAKDLDNYLAINKRYVVEVTH